MKLLMGEIKQSLWNFLRGSSSTVAPVPVKARHTGLTGYWRGVPYEIVVYEPMSTEVRVGVWRGMRCEYTVAVPPKDLPPASPADKSSV